MANSVALEAVVRAERGAGELLNCCRALCVGGFHLLERALVSDRFGGRALGLAALRPRTIPLWYHSLMAMVFVPMSFLNNYSFALGVSQPLQIVVRSISPLTTMVVGLALPSRLKKHYSWQQQLCVLVITAGAVVTTAADALVQLANSASEHGAGSGLHGGEGASHGSMLGACTDFAASFARDGELRSWSLGVLLLLLSALITAGLNQLQDYGFRRWGKDWQESIVFVHLLALPTFWVQRHALVETAARLAQTEPAPAVGRTLSVLTGGRWAPGGLWWMGMDALTMLLCQRGVHSLLAHAGGLALAITLTVRKVLSLLISLVLYSQPFTANHWVGTALVFVGTLAFSQVPKGRPPAEAEAEKAKEAEPKKER